MSLIVTATYCALHYKTVKFKISNGYLQKFLKCSAGNSGRSIKLHGSGGDCSEKMLEDLKWSLIKLKNELSKYDPKFIYNMDETGLNPRKLPDRTYLADDEIPKDARCWTFWT